MSKKIAVIQSCYIPWKGYFDIIDQVDEFIIYDDTQFTKRDWRTRNKIKTHQGLQWLTIPVQTKGKYHQKINDVLVADDSWTEQHWKTIEFNYKKAPYFAEWGPRIQALYQQCAALTKLTDINELMMRSICDWLNINTTLTRSKNYGASELYKTDRLVSLCQQAGATAYLSGPKAKDYIDEQQFTDVNIDVSYIDYGNYPEYPQHIGEFEHTVTILDLFFNVGDNAINFIRKGIHHD